MRIGELSRRTGVSTRLLRYYEEQGLLTARRDTNGYRMYDEESVVVVRQVRTLLAAGLSTEVIRPILPCAEGEQARIELCDGLRGLLEEELRAMDARIAGLRQRRGRLLEYLADNRPAEQALAGTGGARSG